MKIQIICFLLVLILFSCRENITEPQPEDPNNIIIDSSICNVTDGIQMRIENFNNVEGLDGSVQADIILQNISDSSNFKVQFPFYPGYSFKVYDKNMNRVYSGPEAVGIPGINYQLYVGQSYKYQTWWSKKTYSKINSYIKFPAYSDTYLIEYSLSGNPNFKEKYVYKKITLPQSGEQGVFKFVTTYDQYDLSIFVFGVRNRFDNNLTYSFKDKSVTRISILNSENINDTVKVISINYPFEKLTISPKSDSLLFSYSLDKTVSEFDSLSGRFNVVSETNFLNKTVKLNSTIHFVK